MVDLTRVTEMFGHLRGGQLARLRAVRGGEMRGHIMEIPYADYWDSGVSSGTASL